MSVKGLVAGVFLVSVLGCSTTPSAVNASATAEKPKVTKVCVEEPARTGSNMKRRTCKNAEQQSAAK